MRAPRSSSTRRRLVTIVALIGAATIGLVIARGWTAASAQATEPWPSFTMTWRETANGLGLNGAKGTQLFRLEYTDRRHFRTTLLENPTVPDAVGSTWTVGGDRSVFDNVRHKVRTATNFKPDEYSVPSEWLVPGGIDFMLTRPAYSQVALGDGLIMLRNEQTFPDGKVRSEEITFRLVDKIPTRRVTSVNGVEVSRKEVVEFTLGTP